MTRFVHSADWQLGMTRHFLGPEAQARFAAARIEAIRTIGALAEAEAATFVVVCGDVFETNQVSRQVVVRALDAMAERPVIRFYLLPGNHDPLDAASVFRSPTFVRHQPDNVVVLDGTAPVTVEPGVELVAAPWLTKRPLSDLVADAVRALGGEAEGGLSAGVAPTGVPVAGVSAAVRIVAGHGAVDALSPEASNPALISLERVESSLAAGSIDFVALGDRHSTTEVGSSGRVWYAGAPEPTDYDETDPGNVLLVDLAPEKVAVQVRRVGTWTFSAERFDLSGPDDIARLAGRLDAVADKARTVVKLALVGQLSLAEQVELDALLEHHADLLAALENWERHSDLVVLPDDGDFETLGLSGFAREALDDLRRLASEEEPEARAARDALGLLYRLGAPGADRSLATDRSLGAGR